MPKTADKTPKKTPATRRKAVIVPEKPEKSAESTEFYGDLSIKSISERVQIDRATVKKRLDAHKITPVLDTQKLKLYHFDEALEALLLEQDTKLTEAKTRRELAMAEERELKVKAMKNELVDVDEFIDYLGQYAGGLYKDAVVRMPKRLASRLARATTATDCEKLVSSELDKIFQDARANFGKYFAQSTAKRAA